MLDIPKEIKDLFLASNNRPETVKKFKLRFYEDNVDSLYPYETLFPDESLFPLEHGAPWVTIEDDRIVSESLKITESLSESENLEFGSCNASQMEIIVADVAEDLTDREFTLTVEIGGYELALGIYTVKSYVRQSDRRKRKITAYDRMEWFNLDVSEWYNDLTFPMTIKAFRDSLCRYIGIEQMPDSLVLDSMQITKTIEPKVLSGIDVMKSICQINGCFGHVDKTGVFKYIHLQQTGLYPSEDLYPEDFLYPIEFGGDGRPVQDVFTYKQPMTYEDYLVDGITGLSVYEKEGSVGASVGDNENEYQIKGNFLLFGKTASELIKIAESILSEVNGKTYRPAKVQFNAMPWIEPGDAIRIYTNDDIVETFCLKRTISGCQAMMDTMESTGKKTRGVSFGIKSDIEKIENEVEETKKESNAKFEVLDNSIKAEVTRATEAEGKLSSRIEMNAESILLEVTRATEAEGKLTAQIKVEADRITSEVTRATGAEAELGSRITQTATEIRQEVFDKTSGLESKITQTATEIRTEVSNTEAGLRSEIKQTASSITSRVQDAEDNISSVEQTANKINWLVKSGTSASNFVLTDRTISLISNKIDLTGFVTFNDLSQKGKTTINGSNITTGTLDAKLIQIAGEKIFGSEYIGGVERFVIYADFIPNNIRAMSISSNSSLPLEIGSVWFTGDMEFNSKYKSSFLQWSLPTDASLSETIAYVNKIRGWINQFF